MARCTLMVVVFALFAAAPARAPAQAKVTPPVVDVPPAVRGTVKVPSDHLAKRSPARELVYERYVRPNSRKQPAILLHGGPGAPLPVARVLRSIFGDVLLRHFDLVYFDQRGAGRSRRKGDLRRAEVIRARHQYRVEQYVADLEALRKQLFGQRQVTLIGGSWGGFLGLAYAAKHPRAVAALVLGSFASSARYASQVCGVFDQTLQLAETRHPALHHALGALLRAMGRGEVVWRRGAKQRVLHRTDVIELALPFAIKARYRQLTALLEGIVARKPAALKILDQLELNELASAGGSLPGEATFCQSFLTPAGLRALERDPPLTTYCDNRSFARSMLRLCRPYGAQRPFHLDTRLPTLGMRALLFAGKWDPVLDWRETLRVAQALPRAHFVLIDGGHMPVVEGGACFARALDAFFQRRKLDGSCFLGHWP